MKRTKPVETRPPLTGSQKESLFQSALTDGAIYDLLAKSEINSEFFQDLDLHLWYVWEVTEKFYRRQQRLPSLSELKIELEQRIDDPKDFLEDSVVEDMTAFYKILRQSSEPLIGKDTARAYLQQFILEKSWRGLYQLTSERRQVPVSIPDVLDTLKSDIAAATSIAAEPIPSPFELKQYDPVSTKSKMQPYGVPFMDVYLGGGGVAGEVYVVLGPTGSCKTTLLQQLSISLAALQVAKWEHSNKRHSLGMSYFVSYEMAGPEIMARTYANFAQIDIQKIFEGVPLSRAGELSPQDQVLFAKAIEYGIRIPSEKERYDLAKRRLGENWRLLDYSGMSLREDDVPTPEKGSGLWPEIAAQIAADLDYYQKRGQKRHVAGIFIDYIGIMAHRHCQFHDKDPSKHIRIICNESPQNARAYLSYRFRCPVFLAHQLNAAAVKLKPGQIASMTEAQESKTLADNCNAVFVISRPTEDEHRLIRINRQKGRRLPGMGPCILQVQGQYARVREVGSLWSWDELTRQFIPQSEMDVPYREKETGIKPMRFDGQEFETFAISE